MPDMNLVGVYSIINTINGKRYVGSTTVSFEKRKGQHETLLRKGQHTSRHLQFAWDKFGADAFEFVVEHVCNADEALKWEQHYMDLYAAYNDEFGYNILPKAGNHLGAKRTDESKKKMGAWKRSPELGAKISAALKGRKLSLERIEKMRGIKFSDETRAKMRAAHANKSPETLRRMSLAQIGKKQSAEQIANRVAKVIGKKHSPEWNAAISRGNVGKFFSPERREKMAAAKRGKKISAEHADKLHAGIKNPEVQARRIVSLKKTIAARKSAQLCLN